MKWLNLLRPHENLVGEHNWFVTSLSEINKIREKSIRIINDYKLPTILLKLKWQKFIARTWQTKYENRRKIGQIRNSDHCFPSDLIFISWGRGDTHLNPVISHSFRNSVPCEIYSTRICTIFSVFTAGFSLSILDLYSLHFATAPTSLRRPEDRSSNHFVAHFLFR
jgi:hypothetical protein